jgi:hypothetical protein
MRYLFSLPALAVLLLSAHPLTTIAQDASASGPQPVQRIEPVQRIQPVQQIQATTPNNGIGAAAQRSIPYYVDPSRFYYNRPSQRGDDAGRYSRTNYYYGIRPNYYNGYYGCYGPAYRFGYGYYGGGPVYPHPYIRGATVQVGPFIPY